MPFKTNVNARLLPLLLALTLVACSSTLPPAQPGVVKETPIPRLSAELQKQPLPTGSYWNDVTQWRKTWDETLKTLQAK